MGRDSTIARYRALAKVPSVWWSKRLGKIYKLNDGEFGMVVVGDGGCLYGHDNEEANKAVVHVVFNP
jgi:hypothetical protein